LEEQKNPNGV